MSETKDKQKFDLPSAEKVQEELSKAESMDVEIQVPRDRKGSFAPQILPRYGKNTNELEEKILGFYARGISTRDIQDSLHEMYGVDVR